MKQRKICHPMHVLARTASASLQSMAQGISATVPVAMGGIHIWKKAAKVSNNQPSIPLVQIICQVDLMSILVFLVTLTDTDECAFPEQYLCLGQCTNTIGSYSCTCPKGTRSTDASMINCVPYQDPTQTVKMVLGKSLSSCLYIS